MSEMVSDVLKHLQIERRALIRNSSAQATRRRLRQPLLYSTKSGFRCPSFFSTANSFQSIPTSEWKLVRPSNDLLMLMRDVALHYRFQISALSSNEVTLDFNSLFGRNIDAPYARKDHIIDAMWRTTWTMIRSKFMPSGSG
jgi:hypothetical protein